MVELLSNSVCIDTPSPSIFWGIPFNLILFGILINFIFFAVNSCAASHRQEPTDSRDKNGGDAAPFLETDETKSGEKLRSGSPRMFPVSEANGDRPRPEKEPENRGTAIAPNSQTATVAVESRPDGKNGRRSTLPEDANLEADLNIRAEESPPPSPEPAEFDKAIINWALEDSRVAIGEKIREFIGTRRDILGAYGPLYDLLLDYPFRGGKMLRPTLCISTARAVGGMGPAAVSAAAALELYHNAFLIHDDIEDGSEARRGKGTLHHNIGIPRAINVGDATNVLAVGLLLENLSAIGVAKTLNVLHEIEFMARQSVEGQAMELDWVAENTDNLLDRDYFKMCVKKTCWYSFMTPCRVGLIAGHPSADPRDLVEPLAGLTRFGMILGIAFQIQDDLLNLVGDMKAYGKEIGGDIYEGKRTLMLNHAIAHSSPAESRRMLEILATPRPEKTPEQVEFVMEQMRRYGSIEHGWSVARSLAKKAADILDGLDFLEPETAIRPGEKWDTPVHDRRFLKELINYVIYRNL